MVDFLPPRPNPASGGAAFAFVLANAPEARVELFDPRGGLVRALRVAAGAGPHTVHWDGRDDRGRPVPAGVYLARLTAGAEVRIRRFVIAP